MNIFVDESGSFVAAPRQNSWNCVAAYVSPEIDRKRLRDSLAILKRASGVSATSEIKLRDLRESDYFGFLDRLSKLHGILFVVATDAGMNRSEFVIEHQQRQAANLTKHIDKMLHATARQGLRELADRVKGLAPQLYVQLICQIHLIASIVQYGTLYFVQRLPRTLGAFRWRIDQKNSTQTEYEKAFVSLAPGMLESISLREPLAILEGADYRSFQRFDYSEKERPTYLKDDYGIYVKGDGPHLNIVKMMREDLKFEDSKQSLGVQAADLLAAGVRWCLRKQFNDCERGAVLLGRLMVEGKERNLPMQLKGFLKAGERVSPDVARLIRMMQRSCRAMVLAR